MRVNRRTLLRAGAAGVAFGGAGVVHAANAPDYKLRVLAVAKEALGRFHGAISHADRLAVVDFSQPSWRRRLHVVDLDAAAIRSFFTAHGRGSDPGHTGYLQDFSNTPGSKATSRGAYLTTAYYDGKYGRSLRLKGLETANSNAEARAIVLHPAWYVSDDMIMKYGKLGRSEGCFAVREADLQTVLDALGPGRLILAAKL